MPVALARRRVTRRRPSGSARLLLYRVHGPLYRAQCVGATAVRGTQSHLRYIRRHEVVRELTEPRRPRDAQRARVYRAETPMPSSPLPGLDACATFADRVVGTLWWQARFPDRGLEGVPRLRPGNGARQAFFREEPGDGYSITLPRRYRTKGIVLHELVHWALDDQRDLPPHGRTFARVLLDATTEFCGAERAGALEVAFREERVRVARPPRAGPDGRLRYGWDERLRLGRGRRLALRHGEQPAALTGVALGFERSGATVVLDVDGIVERIPTREVWDVQPAR